MPSSSSASFDRFLLRWLALAALLLLRPLHAVAEALPTAPPGLVFSRDAALRESAEVRALAVEPGSGRVAFGDGRAAWLRELDGSVHALLRRGPVTALAAVGDGSWLVGTERGLWQADTHGRQREISPGPGEAARRVNALAVSDGLWIAATGDGAFFARAGGGWLGIAEGLPRGEALALALDPADDAGESERRTLWLVVEGQAFRVTLDASGAEPRADPPLREATAGTGTRTSLLDVALTPEGAPVLVGEDGLVRRDASGAWRTFRPALPPGALLARVGFALGRVWLGTDRGLLVGPSLEGPFERAPSPAGSVPIRSLVSSGDALFAGTRDGLLIGRAAASPTPGSVGSAFVDRDARAAEPGVDAVQRAALVYLDLGPERLRGLRDGAARRGLLPVLGVHFTRAVQRGLNRGEDQSFVSGATRQLADHERDLDRDWALGLTLEWDLGDVAYHPEEIDVSKESRDVIELRDDVLDEITQLFFERRRVLLELGARPDLPLLEQAKLRLRADELAAGLDAWTGGWFGRRTLRQGP